MINNFDETAIRSFANIISDILTHREIANHLGIAGIEDTGPNGNKTERIYQALVDRQKKDRCGNNVLGFILKVINPKRYSDEVDFERHRTRINEKLAYEGYEIGKDGKEKEVNKAKTISEAKERSSKIKNKIGGLQIHSEIIPYCEEEWLKENYFHAILEITKSIAVKMRALSGYVSDGSELVDECFGLGKDKKPMLAFNFLNTPSEESEHKGFANFLKGFFSMYRNPKAHNPKITEDTQLNEMTEVLVIASIIYRRLENTYRTGYK
jgi:uncharacterized protein (TIGR02391 family)